MRYVISHTIQDEDVCEIMQVADRTEMYLKRVEYKQIMRIDWVGIEEADLFNSYEEAEMLIEELPFTHTILYYEEH